MQLNKPEHITFMYFAPVFSVHVWRKLRFWIIDANNISNANVILPPQSGYKGLWIMTIDKLIFKNDHFQKKTVINSFIIYDSINK